MTTRISNPVLLLWIGLVFLSTDYADKFATAEERPISKIADLMATPPEQAAQRKPIRIRGTVSLVADGITPHEGRNSAAHSFCVEDASCGIWVETARSLRMGILQDPDSVLPKLECGVDIDVEGYLDKLGTPIIVPTRITILDNSELPDAPRADLKRFVRGADEIRRVTVTGVVQDFENTSPNFWSFRVETGVGHFMTRLPKKEKYAPDHLVDAEVEMSGMVASRWNWRMEFASPRLIIDREEDVRVRQPAPSDPFTVEKVPLEFLDSYTPQGRPLHRRRIEGTTTYYDGERTLYVQESGLGIRVQLNQKALIEVGDRVEVSGFIDTTSYFAGLRGSSVRRLGRRENLMPIPMTFTQVIEEHEESRLWRSATMKSCDGQLIQLNGRLLSFQVGFAPKPHRLVIDCGDSVMTAFLSGEAIKLSPGTELTVTGIGNVVYPTSIANVNLTKPDRVDLLLRDANDIVIRSRPSWWTAQRVFAALLFVAVFAFSAIAWAFTLRRTLTHQTHQLASEMRNRRDAAIEFQGAIRERTRLAGNLHDTLLQTMAGIAYQVEACGQHDRLEATTVKNNLDTASRMIQYAQDDLRNTVWALHCLPYDDRTFADSVKRVASKISLGRDVTIAVNCAENFPELADFVAGNLLLVIQEAIHNAIKHADASRIDVELDEPSVGDRVSVFVRDNGIGFDVSTRWTSKDGHFGIEGMEQRIERLGGTLAIESQIGVGTTISVDLPLREFDPIIA